MGNDSEPRARRASTGDAQAQLKVRITQELKDLLEEAALKNRSSLNLEITRRLEASCATEFEIAEELESRLAALTEFIGRTMDEVGAAIAQIDPAAKGDWLRSPYAYDQAVRGVHALLEAFRPAGPLPDFRATPWMQEVGERIAGDLLEAAISTPASGWQDRLSYRLCLLRAETEQEKDEERDG